MDASAGLSDNLIKNISGFPDGRISLLTTSILNVYNGGSFQYYRQNEGKMYEWKLSGDEAQYVDADKRLWIKQEHSLQVLHLSSQRYAGNVDEVLRNMGVTQKLKDLFVDGDRNLWFLTENNQLLYYDFRSKERISLPQEAPGEYGVPRAIAQSGEEVWILYSKGLIKRWNSTSRNFSLRDRALHGKINEDSHAIILKVGPDKALWIMHQTELFHARVPYSDWKTAASISGLSHFFTTMDMDRSGDLWLGTSQAQVRVIDGKDYSTRAFTGLPLTTGGTIVNDISSIYVDDDNGVWIGTLFQGVGYYHPSMIKVSLKHTLPHQSHISNENIRGFLEEEDGKILVASGNGLFRYDPRNQSMSTAYPELKGKYCMTLFRDSKGRIWVPTFHNGFYCIQNNKVLRHYEYQSSIHAVPNPNNARNVYEDAQGQLWVSVYGGVGRFNEESGAIDYLYKQHPEIKDIKMNLNFFAIDKNTFAVAGEDLYFYQTQTKKLSFLPYRDRFNRHGAEYNFVYNDRRGLQWLSVDGLKVWNERSKKLYQVTINESRPNQTVSAILEDARGHVWVSTMNGISKIEVDSLGEDLHFRVLNLGRMDGAGPQAGRFNTEAALKGSDGTLYFGGVHGVNILHPEKIIYNHHTHKPVFTGLRVFNTLISPHTPFRNRILLREDLNEAKSISLKHDENFISLEFAGLNYAVPSRTFFKYMLENYDQDWTEVQADGLGRANYTGLPPGKYVFKVYTANNDKVWGETFHSLEIEIMPPFWASIWAKILYFLLFLAGLLYLQRAVRNRNNRKIEAKRKEEELKQKEKLEQLKINFFTNISHEFRTPLSLIMTPLNLLSKEVADVPLKQKLNSIYGHSEDLLKLVNQLLDFRKLEVSGEELRLSYGDFVEFIGVLFTGFHPLAQNKGISFTFTSSEAALYMLFDKDKVIKMVNNLLSNAFKFTPEGGKIAMEVRKEGEEIYLSIQDSGIGIKEAELHRIFERFHQSAISVDNPSGSGIGLYLVKEYAELHQGSIRAESVFGEGAKFVLCLPSNLERAEDQVREVQGIAEGEGRKKVLIVEDNVELRQFLQSQLSLYFDVTGAKNGEEGEQMAVEYAPDLILSDAMMPIVDGITLCKRLKARVETSHIPFILLTAKTSEETKKSVYEAGADSYMSKPFVFDLLLTRIEKLIEQQEKRKALFHTTIEVTPSSLTLNSLDEVLVKKALQSVEENIDHPDYTVDDLGRDMGLSRGNLYRKLQSITGKNPSDFIRSIRLKRAAQLLRDSQLNVGEIADMTGFNGLKYFNKHFKDTFGVTPSQYRSQKE